MAIEIKQLDAHHPLALKTAMVVKDAIASESNLSHRTLREVTGFLRKGQIFGLYANGDLASFLFISPLNKRVAELHCVFTFPKYRNQGYFLKLLAYVEEKDNRKLFAVTFHAEIKEIFIKHGFQSTSLATLPWTARLNFLWLRMHVRRWVSMVRFMSQKRPMYLIKN